MSNVGNTSFDLPYRRESKRPIYALWVVLPMLAIYEVGIAALGWFTGVEPGYRNGVDVFIRILLGRLGIYGSLASVAVVVTTLLVWQAGSRESWRARGRVLLGVTGEGVLYACILIAISLGLRAAGAGVALAAGPQEEVLGDWRAAMVFSFGAGVYEEFVFRLLLVPLAVFVLRNALDASAAGAYIGAAVVSGLLFSASHHIGAEAPAFNALVFGFRTLAGTLLAFFFLARGFAVTSLSHALYDVGVTLMTYAVDGA